MAIVLSAGQGKRMGTSIQKQYIELCGKPIICYCLEAFEKSEIIDDVIMVAGAGQEDYVTEEIVNKYHFGKVRAVIPGGKERYDSVWNGLKAIRDGMAGEGVALADVLDIGDDLLVQSLHGGAHPVGLLGVMAELVGMAKGRVLCGDLAPHIQPPPGFSSVVAMVMGQIPQANSLSMLKASAPPA